MNCGSWMTCWNASRKLRRWPRSRDRYPYLASSTVLMAVLPIGPWPTARSPRANSATPISAAGYVEFEKGPDVWHNRPAMVGWGSIVVSGVMSDRNKWMEGSAKSPQKRQQPLDVVLDLLADENLAVTMVTHYVRAKCWLGPLPYPGDPRHRRDHLRPPHPRLYGSYPRFSGISYLTGAF